MNSFDTFYVDVDERLTLYAVKTPPTKYYINFREIGPPETSMECYYRTKSLDYTDQFPELINMWTEIDHVDIVYRDIDADTPLTVHLSNDDGVTWASKYTTVGNGDKKTKVESFYFKDTGVIFGKFFVLKIESTSSNKNFEWLQIRIHITPRGEYFEVS